MIFSVAVSDDSDVSAAVLACVSCLEAESDDRDVSAPVLDRWAF